MALRAAGAALAAWALAACAEVPARAGLQVAYIPVSALPGWRGEDHAGAYAAFRRGCGVAREPALARICREAQAIGPLDGNHARGFFEAHFKAERLAGHSILTGYFAPEFEARHSPDGEFTAPLRSRPADGKLAAADRAMIEDSPPTDALAWMRPEELFFLQVQGSGVLSFEDGSRAKALYAANNGRPFVSIGNAMREQRLLAPGAISGDAIRGWLAEHRGPQADNLMRLNPRYVFFALAPDDGHPVEGAAKTPLPEGRALAVDPSFHAMGEVLWVNAERPLLSGAAPAYRRLVLALDEGGAIKGAIRADLYVGRGARAGLEAGRIRHTLQLYRLIPR